MSKDCSAATGQSGGAIGTCGRGPATPTRPPLPNRSLPAFRSFLADALFLRDQLQRRLTVTAALDLRDDHTAILRDVLRTYLPSDARAYVFRSRAHGGARRYSDLDLALEWDRPLGLDLIGQIAEALSDFDLPFKVDIVDLSVVEPAFRTRVAADCVPLDVFVLYNNERQPRSMNLMREARCAARRPCNDELVDVPPGNCGYGRAP